MPCLKIEHMEYTPYGELWVEDSDDSFDKIPFRFTSKELDEETNLYYMSARYQNPKTSRWMSVDPAGAGLINPNRDGFSLIESQNWYSYVSNNPIKYTDPTGLSGQLDNDSSSSPNINFYIEDTNARIEEITADKQDELKANAPVAILDTSNEKLKEYSMQYMKDELAINDKLSEIGDLLADFRNVQEVLDGVTDEASIMTTLGVVSGSLEYAGSGSSQTLSETLYSSIEYGIEIKDLKDLVGYIPTVIESKISDLKVLQFAADSSYQVYVGQLKRRKANRGQSW